MNKIITAFLGGIDNLGSLMGLRETGADVIAVAFDFGAGGLRALHDQAIAAGATRCHLLDVREEFAREYVLPAIHSDTFSADHHATMTALARQLIAKKLDEIARIEDASDAIVVSDVPARAMQPSIRYLDSIDRSARIEIVFDNGVPLVLNGISMTLTELFDSLAALAAAHRIGGDYASIRIVEAAYRELVRVQRGRTGGTCLELFEGRFRAVTPEFATP